MRITSKKVGALILSLAGLGLAPTTEAKADQVEEIDQFLTRLDSKIIDLEAHLENTKTEKAKTVSTGVKAALELLTFNGQLPEDTLDAKPVSDNQKKLEKELKAYKAERINLLSQKQKLEKEEAKALEEAAKQKAEEANEEAKQEEDAKKKEEEKKTQASSTSSTTSNSSSTTSFINSPIGSTPTTKFTDPDDQAIFDLIKDRASSNGESTHVAQLREFFYEKFNLSSIGGYRAGDSDGTGHGHGDGLALDLMVSKKEGDEIANYLVQNYEALGIEYIIWEQRFYSTVPNIYGAARTWGLMDDRGSITQNHFDHIHISFKY